MALTDITKSLFKALDVANPSLLGPLLRKAKLGTLLRSSVVHQVHAKVPAASSYELATLLAVELPENARAGFLLWAHARASTAGVELTVKTRHTTPATTEVAISPAGNIVTLATDAVTLLDFAYIPLRQEIVELELPVASNSLSIPAVYNGRPVVTLLEAEATAATATGKKIILAPSASAAAAGQARLNVAKTGVTFNATDAVTKARVKLGLALADDIAALLDADSPA